MQMKEDMKDYSTSGVRIISYPKLLGEKEEKEDPNLISPTKKLDNTYNSVNNPENDPEMGRTDDPQLIVEKRQQQKRAEMWSRAKWIHRRQRSCGHRGG